MIETKLIKRENINIHGKYGDIRYEFKINRKPIPKNNYNIFSVCYFIFY